MLVVILGVENFKHWSVASSELAKHNKTASLEELCLHYMECEAINEQSQFKHVLQHFMLCVENYRAARCHYRGFPCCFTAKPGGGLAHTETSALCSRCECVFARLCLKGRNVDVISGSSQMLQWWKFSRTARLLGKFGWGKWMRRSCSHHSYLQPTGGTPGGSGFTPKSVLKQKKDQTKVCFRWRSQFGISFS